MNWNEPPAIEDVREALQRRAELKAQLELAENTLKIEQARIAKMKPRDTAARVVGIDEETQQILIALQTDIARLRAELGRVEADVEFNNYHREMFKSLSFSNRI